MQQADLHLSRKKNLCVLSGVGGSVGANVALIGCIGVFALPFLKGLYSGGVFAHKHGTILSQPWTHSMGGCVQETNSLFGVPPSMAQVTLGRTI